MICLKNRDYDIVIGAGAINKLLDFDGGGKRAMLVADDNVFKLYGDRAQGLLAHSFDSVHTYVFPAGERSKSLSRYLDLTVALVDAGFNRKDVVFALGGGVTGDLAGFAAATYMRGIDVVQLPTTLLAMIDSSIGGKTGVDLPQGKNLVGAFHNPRLVLADLDMLSTLPDAEWQNGLGEGIKYACLIGERAIELLENGRYADEEFVAMCAEYKNKIVTEDERESGKRRLLNFGHTVGHAIEEHSGYEISHGRAVAEGIAVMLRAAQAVGEIDGEYAGRICALIKRLTGDHKVRIDRQLLSAVKMDKKGERGGKIAAVKAVGVGQCKIETMSFDEFADYVLAGQKDGFILQI